MSAQWFKELCDRYGLDPLPACTVADLSTGRVLFSNMGGGLIQPCMIVDLVRIGEHLTKLTMTCGEKYPWLNDELIGMIAERRHCACGRFARISLDPAARHCEHCAREDVMA